MREVFSNILTIMEVVTDTERIDFMQRIVAKGDRVEIQGNTLVGNQPDMEKVPIQIFTILSQHQYGKNVRKVLDIAIKMERDKSYNPARDGIDIEAEGS